MDSLSGLELALAPTFREDFSESLSAPTRSTASLIAVGVSPMENRGPHIQALELLRSNASACGVVRTYSFGRFSKTRLAALCGE